MPSNRRNEPFGNRYVWWDWMALMFWGGEKNNLSWWQSTWVQEPFALGYINEYDPQAVRRWLAPLVQHHGITVIVTDDLFSYKVVAEKLQLGPGLSIPCATLGGQNPT